MIRDEILSLEPGPALDRLVAEKVMGQTWQGGSPIPGYDGRWPWPPPYSTDIAAAWRVVEKYQERDFGSYLGLFPSQGLPSRVEVVWHHPDPHLSGCVLTGGLLSVRAETIPLAVCRACLLAALVTES